MEKNTKNRKRLNKMEIATKIMCGLLAILMIISAFATCIYYLVTTFSK